jgi:hypothetical protein
MGGRVRASSGLSPGLGWGLALVEVALAAVPVPLAVALHLREPSAVVAAGALLLGAALAVWRGWGPERPPPPGRPRRPVDFFVGAGAAVVAVCAATVVLGAAVEPLGRQASLGVTALVIIGVVAAAPVLFGGPRP